MSETKRYVYLVTIGYESTEEYDIYVYSSLAKAKRKMREKLRYYLGTNAFKQKRPDIINKDFRNGGETFFRLVSEDDCGVFDAVYGRIEKKELL